MVFEAFRSEILKNLRFLKLWGHLARGENDFDSFFSPKMRKTSHEHDRDTAPEMGTRPAAQVLRQRAGGIQSSIVNKSQSGSLWLTLASLK